MKQLLLVGAGDWGREVYSWLSDAQGFGTEWSVKGFLDGNPAALTGRAACEHQVISAPHAYEPVADDVFVCAIANPIAKAKVVEQLLAKGAQFISLIHKSVIFYDEVTVGAGCILAPNVVIGCQAMIQDHVGINIGCSIGHNVEIGRCTQLSCQIDLTGYVKLGERVFVGSSACVIPNIRVGDQATVGAGSVVLQDVEAATTVFGNPARVIKR